MAVAYPSAAWARAQLVTSAGGWTTEAVNHQQVDQNCWHILIIIGRSTNNHIELLEKYKVIDRLQYKWSLKSTWKLLLVIDEGKIYYFQGVGNQSTSAFKEVAIISHPRAGEYAFGFITSSMILQVITVLGPATDKNQGTR
ncbi:hypothetical protein ACQJBY_020758 [Aegilops geniculata]